MLSYNRAAKLDEGFGQIGCLGPCGQPVTSAALEQILPSDLQLKLFKVRPPKEQQHSFDLDLPPGRFCHHSQELWLFLSRLVWHEVPCYPAVCVLMNYSRALLVCQHSCGPIKSPSMVRSDISHISQLVSVIR